MSQIINLNTSGGGNLPTLPAFLTICTAATANVTGDNTLVTLGAGASDVFTTIFDQANSLSGGSAAALTFTAPSKGIYFFSFNLLVDSNSSIPFTSWDIRILTTARTYRNLITFTSAVMNPFAPPALNTLADMNAGATAKFQFAVNGSGGKNLTFFAAATTGPLTWISGYKIA